MLRLLSLMTETRSIASGGVANISQGCTFQDLIKNGVDRAAFEKIMV